jgi:muramoyltetrapeptide carboxypeptidase LdcA involved in peptidoglycan recycling
MIYPKNLEKGYKVGVTATSEGFTRETDIIRLDNGIRHFIELGYPVVETENVRNCVKGRSSDGRTRAKELLQLWQDPDVRVIFAATGGDYLMEMLSFLDYEVLKENPKWLQGFSDTTGLTFTITTNLDIATVYSNNFGSFGMNHWHSSLNDNIKILEGNNIRQNSFDKFQDGFKPRITGLEEYELEKEVEWKNSYPSCLQNNEEISMNGRAIGGCLDVLLNLVGTRFDKTKEFIQKYKEDGILWFLESFDLNSETLVRGLWQLKEAGWFEYAVGFIFGRPAMYSSSTDTDYEEAVLSVLGELKLPIILDADIGHKPPQFTIINGSITNILSRGRKGVISFESR